MTSPPNDELIDSELLELADGVLERAGYTVARGASEGASYLLAEDQDSVITATAVVSAEDAETIEPLLTKVLVDRMSDRSLESKKWDGYVVILSSSRADDATTEALFSLTYNLNQVRRLVRLGIEPTTASVARGLRAILPLSDTQVDAIATSPLAALQTRLIDDGLDSEQVQLELARFRDHNEGGGSIVSDDEIDALDDEEDQPPIPEDESGDE